MARAMSLRARFSPSSLAWFSISLMSIAASWRTSCSTLCNRSSLASSDVMLLSRSRTFVCSSMTSSTSRKRLSSSACLRLRCCSLSSMLWVRRSTISSRWSKRFSSCCKSARRSRTSRSRSLRTRWASSFASKSNSRLRASASFSASASILLTASSADAILASAKYLRTA